MTPAALADALLTAALVALRLWAFGLLAGLLASDVAWRCA